MDRHGGFKMMISALVADGDSGIEQRIIPLQWIDGI